MLVHVRGWCVDGRVVVERSIPSSIDCVKVLPSGQLFQLSQFYFLGELE
jgi:hypothetical protein